MEWLDGVSVRQRDDIDDLGVDREKVADTLMRASLQQMLVDGHFHADPHPGNLMVLADGSVGMIDFGATGRLDPIEQAALREMMVAVDQRDPALLREAVLSVASVRSGVDEDQFERALGRFMARNLGPGTKPDAAMFNQLLQLFFAFGISVPPELTTFFRALVTLEGSLTTLSPGYLAIDAAKSIAAEMARDRLTPATVEDLAKRELVSLLPVLRRIPRHVDRIATGLEKGTIRTQVSLLSDERDVALITKLVNRGVLSFLGAAVGVLSVILLGTTGGPPLTGATSLFQFFGYFGLFCSTVLILRVLVAVVRDGLN